MSREGEGPAPSSKGTGPTEAAARPPFAADSSRSDDRTGPHAPAGPPGPPLSPGVPSTELPGLPGSSPTALPATAKCVSPPPTWPCATAVCRLPDIADALADLAGQGLLARDGGALVLTLPAGRWSP